MELGKISVIIPLFEEETNAFELGKEVFQAFDQLAYPWEVIMVNDGSSDHTWLEIERVCGAFPNFHGIDLGGNFGQSIALRSGFEHSTGEIIIFMDGDLQHNPADIPKFLDNLNEGFDMVGGLKSQRPEGFIQRQMSKSAHWLINKISGTKMSYFGGTFRAYRRFLLENTNILKDSHRFLGAIIARKGVRYTEIPIVIRKRGGGKSSYKIAKLFSVIVDLIFLKFCISFMNKPFRLFGVFGGLMLIIGIIPMLYLVVTSLFFGTNIRVDYGIEFLFSVFLVLIGLIMISFGFVAEIGVYNYFSGTKIQPYSIRKTTHSTLKKNEQTADH